MSRHQRQERQVHDKQRVQTMVEDPNVYESLHGTNPHKSLRPKAMDSAIMDAPPPLPPPRSTPTHRRRYLRPAQLARMDPAKIGPQNAANLPHSIPLLRLSDIVTKHSSCLPMRVQVRNGYQNSAAQLSVSQDEVYDIYFIKHAKVVKLQDMSGKEDLSLPLNSTVEFAVLYNPNNSEAQARKGFLFKNVAEMCASKPLPLVVKATRAYKGSSPESSVEAGELLLLTGVVNSSSFGRGKQLQVLSLTNDGREKLLHEKCAGAFSTKPDDVRMTLAMMVQHKLTFPQTVLIYPDRELDGFLPTSIASSPVVLVGSKKETTIVAKQRGHVDHPVLDIHLSVQIEVEPVQLSEGAQLDLVEDTITICKNFDVSNIQVYMEKPMTRMYNAQSLAYKRVTSEYADGIQLQLPVSLEDESSESSGSDFGSFGLTPLPLLRPPQNRATTRRLESQSSQQACTPVPDCIQPEPAAAADNSVYEELSPRQVDVNGDYTVCTPAHTVAKAVSAMSVRSESQMQEFGGVLRTQIAKQIHPLTERVGKLESAEKSTSSAVARLSSLCTQLQMQLRQLDPQALPRPLLSDPRGPLPSTTTTVAENKEFLASLDCDMVLSLLDALDLPEYRDRFMREQVNGEILLECDEDILENELHVSSRIHRIRLTKLIDGKVSARDVLRQATAQEQTQLATEV